MEKTAYACPTLSMVHILGKKWTIPIIESLYPSRNKASFNNIQMRLGRNITARNLSGNLKELIDANMVKKTEKKENRILHTEYSLTKKGLALREFIRRAKELGIKLYGIDPACTDRRCSECVLFAKS